MPRHTATHPMHRVVTGSGPVVVGGRPAMPQAAYLDAFADEVLAERGRLRTRTARIMHAARILALAPVVYFAAAVATVALLIALEGVE